MAADGGGGAGDGGGGGGADAPGGPTWTGAATGRAAIAVRGPPPAGREIAAQPAGHRPVAVEGWRRMTCTMIGDPRWRGGGMTTGVRSGPRGVIWPVQPATASTTPAAASTLARTGSGRGRWTGMSWVLLGGDRARIWRCGGGCLGVGGVGGDQRGGGHQDDQFGQAHLDQ